MISLAWSVVEFREEEHLLLLSAVEEPNNGLTASEELGSRIRLPLLLLYTPLTAFSAAFCFASAPIGCNLLLDELKLVEEVVVVVCLEEDSEWEECPLTWD